MKFLKPLAYIAICVIAFNTTLLITVRVSQAQVIDFRDTAKWMITDPSAVHTVAGGKQSLFMPAFNGTSLAYLKNYEFKNGTIDVDVMFLGHRSFNGLALRLTSEKDYEYFYFRPQASGKMEALQYAPVFHDKASWQLCSGPGYNAGKEIPTQRWVHIKVVMKDDQAVLYYDNELEPSLKVYELKRGSGPGTVGLLSLYGGCFFADFKVTPESNPKIEPIALPKLDAGLIKEWQISQKFSADSVSMTVVPKDQKVKLKWQNVSADADGTVDLIKLTPEDSYGKKVIYAKVTINSERRQRRKLSLGFSDNITVFLNGTLLYEGRLSHNRYEMTLFRDKEEGVFLDLNKGKNEIVLALSEFQGGFGGWGFQACLDDPTNITFE